MVDPIVEFVPPKLTLDSVDVEVKDGNIIEITSRATVWNEEEWPRFYYFLGDMDCARDGMEISSCAGQRTFVDILTLKLYDSHIDEICIDVVADRKILKLSDYIKIDDSVECEYPRVSVWVML